MSGERIRLAPDPIARFRTWFDDAKAREPALPEATALSTVGEGGQPSNRMVLLKGATERGLEFFTNGRSRKGREIARDPRVALLFHWKSLGRQIAVAGTAERCSESENDAYWRTRGRGRQLGAWASNQSEPLSIPIALAARFVLLAIRFLGRAIPRPGWWGGYRVVPLRIEFLESRPDGLHDRTEFRRESPADPWTEARLQP